MHFGDYWQNQTIEKWPMIWLIIDSIWWTMNIKWRLATLQFAANTFICPLSLGEFVGGPVLMDPFTFSRLYWQKYHSFKALFLLRLRPEVMVLPHRDLNHFVRDCFHIMLTQNGDFADPPPASTPFYKWLSSFIHIIPPPPLYPFIPSSSKDIFTHPPIPCWWKSFWRADHRLLLILFTLASRCLDSDFHIFWSS